MSAALDSRDTRAVQHLLAHCAEVEARPRKPVFERLRELIGADLTRRLLFALSGGHRARSRRAL
jgi:hypothetical protein